MLNEADIKSCLLTVDTVA